MEGLGGGLSGDGGEACAGEVFEVIGGAWDAEADDDAGGGDGSEDGIPPGLRVDAEGGAGVGQAEAEVRGADGDHGKGGVGNERLGDLGAGEGAEVGDGGIESCALGRFRDADEPASADGEVAGAVRFGGLSPDLVDGVVDAGRAGQGGDIDGDGGLGVGPEEGALGPVDEEGGLAGAEGFAGFFGIELGHAGGAELLQGDEFFERLDEWEGVEPGGHGLGVEEEVVVVDRLAQGGGAGEEEGVSEAIGVVPEGEGEAEFGVVVAVPVSVLEEAGEGVELIPGLRGFEGQAGFFRSLLVRLEVEGVSAIGEDEGGAAEGKGVAVVSVF